MPSIEVTCWPATAESGVTHERVAWPSMWTVQAPHCAMPHPYFVPCKPTTSRIAHKRGMSGSASSVVALPLSVKVTDMMEGPHIGTGYLRGERFCRGGGRHIRPPLRTWDWHEPVASGHRKVRRCHAGIGATAPRGGEFNATRNWLDTQRASTTPSFSRIAPTNRANSAASLARGGSAPQTGFGHSGSVLQRATMWMCSCGSRAAFQFLRTVANTLHTSAPQEFGRPVLDETADASSRVFRGL